VHRASGDTQCLPRTNLDRRAINRPGQDALDTVDNLLIGIVLVGRGANFCPAGTRTSNTDALPCESSPVRRNRILSGPILMVSSEGSASYSVGWRSLPCCRKKLSNGVASAQCGQAPGIQRESGMLINNRRPVADLY